MLDERKIRNELFKILKGRGLKLQLFTAEGQTTVDPEEASRFFDNDSNTMFNIDTDEVKIHLSADVDPNREMLKAIKNFATSNMLEFTVRTYGKKLELKDFAYQGAQEKEMQVKESLSKAYGSQKSSYQTLESAKLVIRHSKTVSEEVRGSRSRHIKELFIETREGERFKLPHTSLAGGRAMARHVAMGGTTTDEIGEHINSITDRMLHLKEFVRYARSNGLVNEANQILVGRIAESALEIRDTLKKLTSAKQYSTMIETIEKEAFEVDNTKIAEIRDQFTVKKFEESLEAILPFIATLEEKKKSSEEKDNGGFTDKEIRMAFGVLNDPRYKGGDYSGAYEIINRIAPGLADHPSVARALQRTNETIVPDLDQVFESYFGSKSVLFKK